MLHTALRIPLVVTLLIAPRLLPAQVNIDSLQHALSAAPPDTNTVKLWIQLGKARIDMGELDTARADLQKAFELAHRLRFAYGEGRSTANIGVTYFYQGRYPEALVHFERSLTIADSIGNEGLSNIAKGLLANVQFAYGNYPQALAVFFDLLKMSEAKGDDVGATGNLINIGSVYSQQGRRKEATDYYTQALKRSEKTGNVQHRIMALDNLGGLYIEARETAPARSYYQQAYDLSAEQGIEHTRAQALMGLAKVDWVEGHHDEAVEKLKQVRSVIEQLGDLNTLANVYISIGAIHSDVVRDNDEGFLRRRFNGDLQASLAVAHTYTDSAITLWGEIGNVLDQHTSYLMLSEIEERQGLPVPALQHYKLYKSMGDSLLNAERDKKLTQLGMQYEFDKKEAVAKAEQDKKDALSAEELQRKELQRNALLGFGAFAIVFAVVDLRRRRRIKQELARSEALLLNILPAEVAAELKDTGAAQARHFDTATILFTDFKGFTQLSEKVSPAELVAELNTCFKVFDGLMHKYRIEKIKTIGDAYMAAGGLPDPQHGSAADVVRAALEMQAFMKEHKAEREAAGKPFFEMRVGIHSGPVVAGIVGVKKFQYDIWGDTVNTASRMESSGEVGQVNISEATYELVKSEIALSFTPRGKVQAKGKGEMEMYFVRTD